MTPIAADRNLLTGILGLQTGLINEATLISAMQAWVFGKDQTLEELLVSQGAVNEKQKQFLTQLVQQYLSVHGGSSVTALTRLNQRVEITKLSDFCDAELDQLVSSFRVDTNVAPANTEDPTATFFDSAPGQDQRYQLIRLHARGGLGQVSVAKDTWLHREVALKQIRPEFVHQAESRNRFLVEAEITGRLEHPGIVPVYSLGTTASGPFYVMRLIRGESLKQAIEDLYSQRTQLSKHAYAMAVRKLVRRLVDVGNALSYAHSRGVLHRDVKPSNIMLGKFGETLLVDWGLAKAGTQRSESDATDETTFIPLSGDSSSETRMGAIVGTLRYMSPEQAAGQLNLLGPHSDVYSLGATLYCVLTGESPLADTADDQLVRLIQAGSIIGAHEKNPVVPRAIDAICKKAMAPSISDRYASVHEMVDDLELWLADEPVPVYRESLSERMIRGAKRHRTFVTTFAGVLLTSLIGLLVLNLITQRQNAAIKVARDRATSANEIAQENLDTVQQLSMVLIRNAEDRLSDPTFSTNPLTRRLRTELTEAAVNSFSKVFEQSEPDSEMSSNYAYVLRTSANLQRLGRNFAAANDRLLLSIKLQEQKTLDQRTMEENDYLAETYRDLAALRKSQGKLTEAQSYLNVAASLNQNHLDSSTSNIQSQRTQAVVLMEQAGLLEDLGQAEAAYERAVEADAIYTRIHQSTESNANDKFLYLFAKGQLLRLKSLNGDHIGAEKEFQSVAESAKQLANESPDDGNVVVPYCRLLYWSASNQMLSNQEDPSIETRLRESIERLQSLSGKTRVASHIFAFAVAQRYLAEYLISKNQLEEAEQWFSGSSKSLAPLIKASPSPGYLSLMAEVQMSIAQIKLGANDITSAAAMLVQAKENQQRACQESPENVNFKQTLQQIDAQLSKLQVTEVN